MSEYELTIMLPEKATAAKKKSVKKTIEEMVKTTKGKVKDTDEWGKLDLAHEVDGNTAGLFILFRLELEPDKVTSIEQKTKHEEGIVRHLLVKKES